MAQRIPKEFIDKRGTYTSFRKKYIFDPYALIQRSSIKLNDYLRPSQKGIRRKIFEEALLDNISVAEAIDRAQDVAERETSHRSRGGEEDIFEAMSGNPPYIRLKTLSKKK